MTLTQMLTTRIVTTQILSTQMFTRTLARRLGLLALLGVALIALVACSDDEGDADGGDTDTTATATTEDAATEDAATEATSTGEATSTEEAASDGMEVTDAWARATAGNEGESTAIYATITNGTGEDDTLVSVAVGEEIAQRVEVHEMVQQGDSMVMQMLEGGLPVPSLEMAMLEPGGYHVMLLDVQEQLQVGDTFPATFTFEHAGDVEVDVEVREASAMGSGH